MYEVRLLSISSKQMVVGEISYARDCKKIKKLKLGLGKKNVAQPNTNPVFHVYRDRQIFFSALFWA